MDAPRFFSARAELNALRERKTDLRKVPFRHTALHRWRVELVNMRREGASYRELAKWLREKKRRRFDHTTIRRYLIQLPELNKKDGCG